MLIRRTGRSRRGRRGQEPLADVRGFPWDPRTPLYHGTVALGAIRHGGFKTRAELRKGHHGGPTQATGGGTDRKISFTLDYRVALAIVVGLETFRRLARGAYHPRDFLDRLEAELGPRAVGEAILMQYGVGREESRPAAAARHRALLVRGMKEERGYIDLPSEAEPERLTFPIFNEYEGDPLRQGRLP